MEVAERIGHRLRQLRTEAGLTQQSLASRLDVSQSTIAGVESGAQLPGAALLGRLSDLFRVNLDFFYREKENPFEVLLRAENIGSNDIATLRDIRERCLRYKQIEEMAKAEVPPTPQYQPPPKGVRVVDYAERIAEKERLRLDVGFDPLTDLPKVLEDEGVRVLGFESDSQLDGLFLSSDEEGSFALINTKRAPSRQLFTLAHEYCHILLHRGLGARLDYDILGTPKKGDLVEIAAGAFAAAFLMPAFKVREVWDRKGETRTSKLIWLKRSLGVSYSALGWRLLNLGLIAKSDRESLENGQQQIKATEELLYGSSEGSCSYARIPQLSDRLKFLAQRAYLSGEVSVSKLAEWLEVDIVTADEIAKALQDGGRLHNAKFAG